jgi:hypothetical protein
LIRSDERFLGGGSELPPFACVPFDAALLYERGDLMLAALYVAGSVMLSIGGLLQGLR